LSSKVPPQPQISSQINQPTSAGKENHQNHTHHLQKDRAWQEELLGAFLPQVQEEHKEFVQTQTQAQAAPQTQAQTQAQAIVEPEGTKSKVIVFSDPHTNDTRLSNMIKLSIVVSLFTALLLWFFEPSFVQSVNTQHLVVGGGEEKDVFFDANGDVYVSSRSKIIFWSFLSGIFAFSVLYSIPSTSSSS
jgi:uncharacterized protein with PQ loop repeat